MRRKAKSDDDDLEREERQSVLMGEGNTEKSRVIGHRKMSITLRADGNDQYRVSSDPQVIFD